MTGKELIMYILQNNLEDLPINADGGFLNLITAKQAAAKFDVGEATVRIWYQIKAIDGVMIGEELYILPTSTPTIDF